MAQSDNHKKRLFTEPFLLLTAGSWLLLGFIIFHGSEFGKNCVIFQEDNLLEWLQVVFLFISSGLCFFLFVKGRKKKDSWNLHYLFFCLFLLWIGLEEISYGQRIFGYESPYFFLRQNAHREVNIHNLPFLDRASEIMSSSIMLLWGVILPVAVFIFKKAGDFAEKHRIFLPCLPVAAFCILGLLLEIYFRAYSPCYWPFRNEILETFLYGAILLTAVEKGFFPRRKSEKGNLTEEIE